MVSILFVIFLSCTSPVFADLYKTTDPLVILNTKNFYEELIGVQNGWIIEFYNSWCGHCIGFAPTWNNFSSEVIDWSHTFKVGVIDCSDEENIPICRDYEVMGYPSVRIFGPNVKKGDIGANVEPRTIDGLQKHIVNFILEKQTLGQGSPSWVNLLEYNDSVKNIFKYAPSTAEYAVLVVEKANQPTSGSYTVLDLGKYPMVYARRITEEKSKEVSQLGISKYPAVVIIGRDGKREIFTENIGSRNQTKNFVIKHLRLDEKLRLIDKLKPASGKHYASGNIGIPVSQVDKDEREGAGDGQPDEISSDRLNYDDELPDSAYRPHNNDQVYMVDIENALSYALRSEVALHRIISGEHLSALRGFLDAVVDFLPVRPQVHTFLVKLRNFVAKTKETLTAQDLEKAIQYITSASSVLPDVQAWVGCQGSEPHYRGYPCGLWTLFHTLTVNSLLRSNDIVNYDPHRPLRAVHGYVKYFFSCKECSKHFQEMYALDAESSVQAPNDEVLWLWSAHNKVNKRLHGDLSEDPKHPKIQFPSKAFCPTCWTKDGGPNRNQILLYLKKIYGKGALSLEGTQLLTSEETRMNKQARVIYPVGQRFLEGTAPGGDQNISAIKMNNSWGFNSMDVNLCIMLYFSSTVIIAGGYLMFLLKRRLRRKKYLELYKLP